MQIRMQVSVRIQLFTMAHIPDLRLIELVQPHDILYDSELNVSQTRDKKIEIWKKIAIELNLQEMQFACKYLWHRLNCLSILMKW